MKRVVFTVALTACAWLRPVSAAEPAQKNDSVVLEIGGKKLTMADIEEKHPGGLFQARNTYFEAQKKAVEEYVDEYLLEQQARKENVTVAELLNRHVNSM